MVLTNKITARIIASCPISLEVTAGAVGGQTTLEIVSASELPLSTGQVISLALGAVTYSVVVDGDQEMALGPNTLVIEPALTAIDVGANTDAVADGFGNPVQQTVTCMAFLSIETSESDPENHFDVGADKQSSKYRGRFVRPSRHPAWLHGGTHTIEIQHSDNSYFEGQAILTTRGKSRMGLNSYFGDPITCTVVSDNPMKFKTGVIQ